MRRFFAGLMVVVACFAGSQIVFGQSTDSSKNNSFQYVSDARLKTLQEEAQKGQKAAPKPSTSLQIPWNTIAIIVSILSGLAAIFGYSISSHRKKMAISKYMEEIDSTFTEYKTQTQRCEAELYRLHTLLEERLKKGKVDESLFELLTKRIDKYLHQIQNPPKIS